MRHNKDRGREAVELLASSYVLGIGVFICIVFAFAFSRDPKIPLAFCVSIVVIFFGFNFLFRDRSKGPTALELWFTAKKPEKPLDYTPKVRRRRRSSEKDNAPPTLEQVKEEQKTSLSTWVPSSSKQRPRE